MSNVTKGGVSVFDLVQGGTDERGLRSTDVAALDQEAKVTRSQQSCVAVRPQYMTGFPVPRPSKEFVYQARSPCGAVVRAGHGRSLLHVWNQVTLGAMKYIDTGSRRPDQSLGEWLTRTLRSRGVQAIRWQTGYFSAEILDYFKPQLARLSKHDALVRVLIGSNDGRTKSSDLKRLLTLAGAPRSGLQLGVVSYGTGYFHPKTVHITRNDGSQAAYVGSANLTRSGAELHVEAGVVLDSAKGDDPLLLQAVARAIDDWFGSSRPGLHEIGTAANLSALIKLSLLDRRQPPKPPLPPGVRRNASRLKSLRGPVGSGGAHRPGRGARMPTGPLSHSWTKVLSASDAQRKGAGNQRGSITLVRGASTIDARTWFRRDFLGDRVWVSSKTRTGRNIEITSIEFNVSIRGRSLGLKTLPVSFDKARESSQSNYTTLLHLGDLSDNFARQDFSKLNLTLARTARGEFFLTIL